MTPRSTLARSPDGDLTERLEAAESRATSAVERGRELYDALLAYGRDGRSGLGAILSLHRERADCPRDFWRPEAVRLWDALEAFRGDPAAHAPEGDDLDPESVGPWR